jgi:hypothetical protein
MKVIFVGMHNKPGMQPLDSRTMSGKIIDALIEKLNTECVKTNLCDVEYMPKDFLEINNHGIAWHERVKPELNDVVVLLGNWVHKNFWHDNLNTVKLKHPASCMGRVNKEEYVKNAISVITTKKLQHGKDE